MNWSFELSVGVLILLFLKPGISQTTMVQDTPALLRIVAPTSHVALSGDVTVVILASTDTKSPAGSTSSELEVEENVDYVTTGSSSELSKSYETIFQNPALLRVLYQNGLAAELIGEFPFEIQPPKNDNASVIIPCSTFSRGGTYTLQLEYKFSTMVVRASPIIAGISEIQMNSALQVQWPMPSLFLDRQRFNTYPSKPILATLKYSGIACVPSEDIPVTIYTLNLVYCGYNLASCEPQDKNRTQVLYYEELKGFVSQKVIILRCELFGLAGNYVLNVRASDVNSNPLVTSAYIKVEWSDEFKFNVHARSVYPCEGSGGVPVLFEYPTCRLQGDRVRVYGRLRADVASFAPPSTLHYITELKATPGKYTLNFDCEIFTEKFVEYCFVYVSQAITGAMAEIRIACIPTFPLQESDAGGWGPWSPWTPCSSSCVGGTRSRYRFCDTPPPSYGAEFCQGQAVETESCGGYNLADAHSAWDIVDWKCRHGSQFETMRSEVTTEIGLQCRCGCIVNFREKVSRKVLAANTQACPGRSFWLLQARSDFSVALHLDQAQFPCSGQYFRVRDGDSLSANLLTDIAFDKNSPAAATIVSTGQSLLLEFFSDELSAATESCVGGFLAHAAIFRKQRAGNGTLSSLVPFQTNSTSTVGQLIFWMTPAHLAAASLVMLIFFISISLALQFAYKYRKYQIAEDLDNLSDNFICSESMQDLTRLPKSLSSSTMISEIVSLVDEPTSDASRDGKRSGRSRTAEDGYESSETQTEYEDEFGASSETLKLNQPEDCHTEAIIPNKLNAADKLSSVSSITVVGQPEVKYARPIKLRTLEPLRTSSTPKLENTSSMMDESKVRTLQAQKGRDSSLNASTVRGGKETKDRRNRERLLHGPSTEFNMTNTDVDLELDYYDYNVANAGAAPGSYLGMDPAFLVWIPPFTSGDPENLVTDEADPLQGLESRLYPSTEGLTLTPAEYRRIKLSRAERASEGSQTITRTLNPSDASVRGCPSETEGSIHSEQNSIDRRTRLNERLLPLHRILEDSRVRVSEESLSSHINIKDDVPDIFSCRGRSAESKHETDVSPERHDNRLYEEQVQVFLNLSKCNSNNSRRTTHQSSGNVGSGSKVEDRSTRARGIEKQSRVNEQEPYNNSLKRNSSQRRGTREERKNVCEENSSNANSCEVGRRRKVDETGTCEKSQKSDETEFFYPKLNIMTTQYRHREFAVNIPMTELSGIPIRSPARVLKYAERVTLTREEIQSPDYGVETEMNGDSQETFFFALNRNRDDGIKFADDDDDDDDECIDNKIIA